MYHLTLLHLLTILIRVPKIGHPMIIASNVNLLTSYSAGTRCLLGISISYSTFGLHLFLSMMMKHPSQTLQICTTLLTLLLLVTSPGKCLVYSIMGPNLLAVFHHGCKLSMMPGSEIPVFWSKIFYQIPISSATLIMHHFKSTLLKESIIFETSCLQSGLGVRL
jgi:hypothetical protein